MYMRACTAGNASMCCVFSSCVYCSLLDRVCRMARVAAAPMAKQHSLTLPMWAASYDIIHMSQLSRTQLLPGSAAGWHS